MNLLYYLAEANIYLGVFYLAYRLFLTKETYYQLTRVYLLFGCVVSFILPVLQIGALKPVETAVTKTINYTIPQKVATNNEDQEFYMSQQMAQVPLNDPAIKDAPVVKSNPEVVKQPLTLQDYLLYIYLAGATVLFLMLIAKLYALFRLIRNASGIDQDNHKLVYLPESNAAFSFFNYLFIGNDVQGADTIIRHELVHIRQKHSVDIVFLELLKIINWFNPFVYLLQNSLKTVHEYIADEQTAAYETNAIAYSSFLVNNAYGAYGSSITHSFLNHNLLKKRIIMLNQRRSGSLARLKYLVTLPICALLLCASTLAFSKTYGYIDLDPAKNAFSKHPSNHIINAGSALTTKSHLPVKEDILNNIPQQNADLVTAKKDKQDAVIPSSGLKNSAIARTDSSQDYNLSGFKRVYENMMFDHVANASDLNYYTMKGYYEGGERVVKGGIVVIGYTITDEHKLSDIKVVKSTNNDLNPFVIRNFRSYNGEVGDTPGPHTFLINYSTHGHTEKEDAIMCRQNGYENHLTIAIGSYLPVKNDTPESNTVSATADNPDAIFRSDLNKFYKNLKSTIKYPVDELEKSRSGEVNALFSVDTNHKIQYVEINSSPSETMSNEVINALKSNTSLNIFKPGSQYVIPVFFQAGNTSPRPFTTGRSVSYNPKGVDIPGDQTIWSMDVVSINNYIKK